MSTVRQYKPPHFETTVKMHLSREYLVEEKQVEPEVTLDLPLLFQCPATTTTKMTPPASCYGDQQKKSPTMQPHPCTSHPTLNPLPHLALTKLPHLHSTAVTTLRQNESSLRGPLSPILSKTG